MKTLLKIAGLFFLLFVLLQFGRNFLQTFSALPSSAPESIPSMKSIQTVSARATPITPMPPKYRADVIAAAYAANEVAADDTYKGQPVRVAGIVTAITKTFLGSPIISLSGAGGIEVHCIFPAAGAALAALNRGDAVGIQGTVEGLTLGIVRVDGCELQLVLTPQEMAQKNAAKAESARWPFPLR